MKYSNEEALEEILHRKDKIINKREKHLMTAYSCIAVALAAMLVFIILVQPGRSVPAMDGSIYASLLLTPETGGYILDAVIAFAMGVIVTLIAIKHGNKKKINNKSVENAEISKVGADNVNSKEIRS